MKTSILFLTIAATAFALCNCTVVPAASASDGSAAGSDAGRKIGQAANP
ncbi:MAG: hypothetical protein V4689_07155 [Verrucomicrobiota bacterium]